MKQILIKLTAICAVMAAVTGCGVKEVSKTPLSYQYIPAENRVQTRYTYRMTLGGLKYVPVVETVRHPERYEIYYAVEYDDGSSVTEWQEVSKEEYEQFREETDNEKI